MGEGEDEEEDREDRDQVPSDQTRQGAVKSWASFWSFLLRSQNGLGMRGTKPDAGREDITLFGPSRPADPAGI